MIIQVVKHRVPVGFLLIFTAIAALVARFMPSPFMDFIYGLGNGFVFILGVYLLISSWSKK